MKQKLDHIWGNTGGGSAELTALENKVNNLSQIAAKTNLDNRFTAQQTIPSVIITGAVDANNKAATKQYVDEKLNLVVLQTWNGNLQTTNMTWTKTTEFNNNGSGIYLFQIKITTNNKSVIFNEIFKITNLADTYIGPIHTVKYDGDTAGGGQFNDPAPVTALSFIYTNKAIRLKQYGNGHPTSAAVEVRYTKLW